MSLFGKKASKAAEDAVASETTALTNAAAGAVATEASKQASELAKNTLTQENLDNVSKIAAERFDDVSKSLVKGDMSIRLLALVGGAALAFFAFTGFLGDILSLSWNAALMEIYTLALAIIMVALEVPGVQLPEKFLQVTYKYCLFLKFIWGRGILYFIGGNLQFSQGGLWNLIVGAYVMLVGIMYIAVGRSSAKKLSDLKHNLHSEGNIKKQFERHDANKDGKLDLIEFGTLCDSMDLDLTKKEKEVIFFHLDTSDDNLLTLEEFKAWWNDFDASVAAV